MSCIKCKTGERAHGVSDPKDLPKPPTIPETVEDEPKAHKAQGLAKEQIITPFDVEAGVDEDGRPLEM